MKVRGGGGFDEVLSFFFFYKEKEEKEREKGKGRERLAAVVCVGVWELTENQAETESSESHGGRVPLLNREQRV